ncbi:MAG: hypothetical protein BroJett042_20770 [Bacteroidota bacterium]|nr:MAG: hypothetical protein BroJett042_20770 [Bacteroidota bacterium]
MKNPILLMFLASFLISIIGAILKINGTREIGNTIMLVGAGLQLITIVIWLIKQRNNIRNEVKS